MDRYFFGGGRERGELWMRVIRDTCNHECFRLIRYTNLSLTSSGIKDINVCWKAQSLLNLRYHRQTNTAP